MFYLHWYPSFSLIDYDMVVKELALEYIDGCIILGIIGEGCKMSMMLTMAVILIMII